MDLTPVQVLLDRAAVHYSRKEWQDAARLWAEVLDVEAENACAADNLGVCFDHGRGVPQDRDRAFELVEQAYHTGGGNHANTAYNLGHLSEDKGDIPKAMTLYEEARRGGHVWATCNLGTIYQEKGNIPKAMALWEEARRGGHAAAAFNLGILYQKMGDIPRAMALCEEARRGGDIEAAVTLGNLYYEMGDSLKALALYEEARRSGNATAAYNLGVFHEELGDAAAAMALYEEARYGGDAKAAFNSGVLFNKRGDSQKAAECFAQAYHSGDEEVRRRIVNEGLRLKSAKLAGCEERSDTAIGLRIGDRVKIDGLCNKAGGSLNGKAGHIVKFDAHTNRYEVKADACAEPTAIQRKNLRKLDVFAEDASAASSELTPQLKFRIGDLVWVHSLTSGSAASLNGRSGSIVSFNESTGRYGVEVHGGHGRKAIRPASLYRADGGQRPSYPGSAHSQQDLAAVVEELSSQAAIAESTVQARASQDAGDVNAQISQALIRSGPVESSEPTLAISAPPTISLSQCFPTGTLLLQAEDDLVPAERVSKGMQLRSLRGDGDQLVFQSATVKAVRVLPPRERDLAEVALAGRGGTTVVLTADHTVLVHCRTGLGWTTTSMGEVRPKQHSLFVHDFGRAGDTASATHSEVESMKTYVDSCEMVEVELEDPESAIFMQVASNTFVATLGTPPREPLLVVQKRGFIEIQEAKASGSQSSLSDPTAIVSRTPKVYRTIHAPHDDNCDRVCRYHLKGACAKGKLCTRCHHPDHQFHNRRAPQRKDTRNRR